MSKGISIQDLRKNENENPSFEIRIVRKIGKRRSQKFENEVLEDLNHIIMVWFFDVEIEFLEKDYQTLYKINRIS